MKLLKALSKKAWISIASGAAVTAAVVGGVVFFNQEKDYRQIQVYQVEGTAYVDRQETKGIEAYENMQLQSEDILNVSTDSYLQLKLDEDKYVLLEPDTRIRLEASGNSTDSRTKIHLEQGAVVSNLENPLSPKSSYEVNSPNSTMAVRGTVFRVEVTYGEDGVSHTKLSVYEGKVGSRLVFPDGSISDEEVPVAAGSQVRIWGNEEDSDYEGMDEPVSYEELKTRVLEFLNWISEDGRTLSVSGEELEELLKSSLEKEETEKEADNGKEETEDNAVGDKGAEEEPKEEQPEEDGEQPQGKKTPEKGQKPQSSQGTDNSPKDGSGNSTPADNGSEDKTEETGTCTVTFIYQGTVFATQKVTKGEKVKKPQLMPAKAGSWDFDFSQVVTKDTEISWK